MTTATSSLLACAKELTVASDREDWAAAATLLAQINKALQQTSAFDKKTLETVLAAIEHATQDTERRRDEIGVLVKALGGSSVSTLAGQPPSS